MKASVFGVEGPLPFVITGPPRPASGTRAALARRVPVIHAFTKQKTWMAGTSPAMTIQRVKPGNDWKKRLNHFLSILNRLSQWRVKAIELTRLSAPGARR